MYQNSISTTINSIIQNTNKQAMWKVSLLEFTERVLQRLQMGLNQDEQLNSIHPRLENLGIELDYEYLLKCTDVEQAEYYLKLIKEQRP